jgi:hypothetical protein
MHAATLAPAASPKISDPIRLRDLVLVRVAIDSREMMRADVAKDIAPLVAHRLSAVDCRHGVDRHLAALADAGLVTLKSVSVTATVAGRKRAQMVIGGKGGLPKSWREARDIRLIAKALGCEELAPARLKLLAKADGLKCAIVQQAFAIALRGAVTPSRLRSALAVVALDRAFGKSGSGDTAKKTGLSAKDGRALAGQLTNDQRNYGTDARLIAALATQVIGATGADLASLQGAVLRRYVEGTAIFDVHTKPAAGGTRRGKRAKASRRSGDYRPPVQLDLLGFGPAQAATPVAADASVATAAPVPRVPVMVIARPDLAAFVASVRQMAEHLAEGWPGNRKAYISRVWRATEQQHPEWGLSEIEFKAMLTEAHRAGDLALVHADLKDKSTLRDVQESQIAFKNTIFHFIRADG